MYPTLKRENQETQKTRDWKIKWYEMGNAMAMPSRRSAGLVDAKQKRPAPRMRVMSLFDI